MANTGEKLMELVGNEDSWNEETLKMSLNTEYSFISIVTGIFSFLKFVGRRNLRKILNLPKIEPVTTNRKKY